MRRLLPPLLLAGLLAAPVPTLSASAEPAAARVSPSLARAASVQLDGVRVGSARTPARS